MLVLWLLILRGIAIELSHFIASPLWKPFWGFVFGAASGLLALLYGAALGNVVRGVPLDSNGYFFLPLWTNFLPGREAGIVDWYTLLVGAAAFAALALHGGYWVILTSNGALRERSRTFAASVWWGVVALTILVTIASFRIQPHLFDEFVERPWGYVFPLLAIAGLLGMRVAGARSRHFGAFLFSSLYLTGMLTSVVFGVFPYVLPSNQSPEASLTVTNAAAARYGLYVGLWWWIPGMLLAGVYSVYAYRRLAARIAG